MRIVQVISNRILFVKVGWCKILPLHIAYPFWIVTAVKIIALEICFAAYDIIVINTTTKCCIDAGVDSVLPVNVNGVYSMNGNISYGFPVHFLKGSLDISSVVSAYHGKQFANTPGNIIRENTINTITVGPEVRLDMSPADKLNLSLTSSFNYSKTKYSLPSARNSKYFTQEYGVDLDWQFAKGFLLALPNQ